MELLLSDEVVAMVGSILGAALLFLVRAIFKDRAAGKEALFKLGVDVAYNVVNDLAARTENKIDDKIAVGLRALREFLGTHGQELKAADEARAKLLFRAMHGAEKATGQAQLKAVK